MGRSADGPRRLRVGGGSSATVHVVVNGPRVTRTNSARGDVPTNAAGESGWQNRVPNGGGRGAAVPPRSGRLARGRSGVGRGAVQRVVGGAGSGVRRGKPSGGVGGGSATSARRAGAIDVPSRRPTALAKSA